MSRGDVVKFRKKEEKKKETSIFETSRENAIGTPAKIKSGK